MMPAKAQMMGLSGEVHLLLVVTNGEIRSCSPYITNARHRVFVESAVKAIMASEFEKPTVENTSQVGFVTYSFKIEID